MCPGLPSLSPELLHQGTTRGETQGVQELAAQQTPTTEFKQCPLPQAQRSSQQPMLEVFEKHVTLG
jgi:hypothetical protein